MLPTSLYRAFKGTRTFRCLIQLQRKQGSASCYRFVFYFVSLIPLVLLWTKLINNRSTKTIPILLVSKHSRHDPRSPLENILQNPSAWRRSDVIRIPTVNGRAESISKLANLGVISKVAFELLSTEAVSKGERFSVENLGRYMSHVKIWRTVIDLNQPAVILEDDVNVLPLFSSKIEKALTELPNDWGMLYLESLAPNDLVKESEHELSKTIIRKTGNSWGTNAYVISPSAAHILLLHAHPIEQKLNTFLPKITQFWGVKVFQLKRNVVETSTRSAESKSTQFQDEMRDDVPTKIFVLCSDSLMDETECKREISSRDNLIGLQNMSISKNIAKNHLKIHVVEEEARQIEWETAFVAASKANFILQQEVGEEVARKAWSYFARVHISCLAILKQNGGGVCIDHRTQILRPIQHLLRNTEMVVGSTWKSEISPTIVAAAPNSTSVDYMLSLLMNLNTKDDSKKLLEQWQTQESTSPNVRVLPSTMTDPLPMVSPKLLDKPQFDELALAFWQPPPTSENTQRIPQILHFIWIGNSISTRKVRTLNSWMKMHPNWQVHLWTENDLAKLDSAEKIFSSNDMRQRADIARYEIVWKHGGVFVDSDFECFKPIDPLVNSWSGFVCHENGDKQIHLTLSNGLFGFRANHPVLARAMRFAAEAELNTEDVNLTTGPMMFRHAIGDEIDKLLVVPKDYFYPISYYDRQLINDWQCNVESCKTRFPNSYGIHLWSTETQGNVESEKLDILLAMIRDHNLKAT